jgi:hypothetical protein
MPSLRLKKFAFAAYFSYSSCVEGWKEHIHMLVHAGVEVPKVYGRTSSGKKHVRCQIFFWVPSYLLGLLIYFSIPVCESCSLLPPAHFLA